MFSKCFSKSVAETAVIYSDAHGPGTWGWFHKRTSKQAHVNNPSSSPPRRPTCVPPTCRLPPSLPPSSFKTGQGQQSSALTCPLRILIRSPFLSRPTQTSGAYGPLLTPARLHLLLLRALLFLCAFLLRMLATHASPLSQEPFRQFSPRLDPRRYNPLKMFPFPRNKFPLPPLQRVCVVNTNKILTHFSLSATLFPTIFSLRRSLSSTPSRFWPVSTPFTCQLCYTQLSPAHAQYPR